MSSLFIAGKHPAYNFFNTSVQLVGDCFYKIIGMDKVKQPKRDRFEKMPVVILATAGIDVGSRSHFVGIGQNKEGVKEFGVYTGDLHAICRLLVAAGRTTVALESTGSYRQPLFVLLQKYNLAPILVDGKFATKCKRPQN